MKNLIWGLILTCLLLNTVSALTITPSIISVNKTVGSQTFANFQVLNPSNFVMYNISFSDSSILNLPKISSLNPGAYANVSAEVISNTQGLYNLDLQGYYFNNVGSSSNIYQINVSSNSVDDCSKTVTFGDTIKFSSSVLDPIQMFNSDTSVPIEGSIIGTNQIFSYSPSVGILHYYFKRNGFQFAPVSGFCTLNVLNTTGLINDPQLDGSLQFTLLVNYPPTNISYAITQTNYTMSYSDSTDGIMSLTNTGNSIAHVSLSGDWFTFNNNNFDLNPSQTKGIIYTITPQVLSTDQTGIIHSQNIQISGNFPTQNIPISVFINHADLSNNSTLLSGNLTEAIRQFCLNAPQFCQNPVIRQYINNASELGVNVTITQETLNGVLAAIFDIKDQLTTSTNDLKLKYSDLDVKIGSINDSMTNSSVIAQQAQASSVNLADIFIYAFVMFLLVVAIVLTVIIYRLMKKRREQEELQRY